MKREGLHQKLFFSTEKSDEIRSKIKEEETSACNAGDITDRTDGSTL